MNGYTMGGTAYLRLKASDGTVVATGQKKYERSVPVEEGPFLKWVWDGEVLEAQTDRFGMQPCYYACLGSTFYIATSIQALLRAGVPAELDDDGLSVMLHFGQCTGDLTIFRHIRALPPGGRLIWSIDGFSVTGEPWSVPSDPLPRNEVMDGYIDLFRQSMSRHLVAVDDFVLPLSGGRDSRHIAFEAVVQKRRPKLTFTVEHLIPERDDDLRIARDLAEELGLAHVAVPNHPGQYIDAEIAKFSKYDWLSFEHQFSIPMDSFLMSHPRHALFDGLGGDVLSAGLFLTEQRIRLFDSGRFDELARTLCSPAPGMMLRQEAAARWNMDRAVPVLAGEMKRHANAGNSLSCFFFWNRTRRNIALVPYQGLAVRAWPVMTPYVTPELFALLASQPASLYLDHRLHDDTIARAYPQWAHIPYETKSPSKSRPLGFTYGALLNLWRNSAIRKSEFLDKAKLASLSLKVAVGSPRSGIWWDATALYIASLEHFVRTRAAEATGAGAFSGQDLIRHAAGRAHAAAAISPD